PLPLAAEPRRTPVAVPAAPAVPDAPVVSTDARRGARAASPADRAAPNAAAPGRLEIEVEHHLRHGNLHVWVDDVAVVDDEFDGRVTRKILSIELRKGLVQQRLTLAPGPHEVRVQVRWEDNVKSARISGQFRPGASRRLEVQVGRLRGN